MPEPRRGAAQAATGLSKTEVRRVWLQGAAEPFPVFLHHASGPVGVVLCPPFGWDEMCSYRPRREWAQLFATAGAPAVRLDLPGQGDAGGGPASPDRLSAWTDAIGVAATWLLEQSDCHRVVAVGMSLGGLLALRAAAGGAPVHDFVLWGVPATGRSFTRELRAFSRMEAGTLKPDDRSLMARSLPEGAIAAGGYLLSAQTRRDLEALDDAPLEIPHPEGRAALMLERDGTAPPADVVAGLRAQGIEVEIAAGRGYGRMLVEPQFARLPADTAARAVAFVVARAACAAPSLDALPRAAELDEAPSVGPAGEPLRERAVTYARAGGAITGTLTEPVVGPVVPGFVAVLLGGTGHRIGPNRMWVEIARRWAASGVPTVRVDLVGAGEAEGAAPDDVRGLYAQRAMDEVGDLLDAVAADHHAQRIVCVGLCAGAYWGLHTATAGRPRVLPFMVNLPTLLWDDGDHLARMTQHYRRALLEREAWRRLLRREVAVGSVLRRVTARISQPPRRLVQRARGGRPVESRTPSGVLNDLLDQGNGAWMFFSGQEALQEQLERDGMLMEGTNRAGLHVDVVRGRSDLHTLRPLWLQQEFHDRIDAALRRELDRVASA